MLTISDAIRPTVDRYKDRAVVREANLRRLQAGQVLSVDDPRRVAQRLRRLRAQSGRASFQERIGLERILGDSDLMPVRYFERGTQVARSIGRVQIRTRSGQTVGYGTGGMVSPRLLITNHHVLSDPGEAGFSRVEFDFEEDADGARRQTTVLDLDPTEFFLTDKRLDVTLVAIRDPEGLLRGRRWNPLLAQQGKVIIGECLSIIQHPNGELKQLALRENRLIDVLRDYLHYKTDTAPGSSGSLVFSDDWEVVALHHMGVPRRDDQGNYLMKDGTPWQDGMDDSLIDWVANEGIRASRIVELLKAAPLDARQRGLLEPVFEPVGFANESGETTAVLAGSGPATWMASDNTRSGRWVVPIEISVSVGGGASSRPGPGSGARPPIPPNVPGPEPALPPVDEPALKASLAEAKAGQKKPYYEAQKDGTARKNYYAGLALGTNKSVNFRKLRDLLAKTHTTKPAYAPTKTVYPWVDLHPDKKLRSIYSNKSFSPQELIRLDFEVMRRREFFENSLRAGRAESTADLAAELDLLEANMPYNCEHVVPQSWFGKKEPMRGDIHHLFACESDCNSFRGNTPYYEFGPAEEALRSECGRREGNRFEPDAGKSIVARAVLYFLLRYPGEINAIAGEYTKDRVAILLGWHAAVAPTQYEKHRNAAIFAAQGNRNPLIDHPEWAGRIDFVQGLG